MPGRSKPLHFLVTTVWSHRWISDACLVRAIVAGCSGRRCLLPICRPHSGVNLSLLQFVKLDSAVETLLSVVL